MDPTIEVQYKAKLRELIATKGRVVNIVDHSYVYPDEYPWDNYSIYGWSNWEANVHITGQNGEPCPLVVPQGVEVRELTYTLFDNTFDDNMEEVGVNAYGGDEHTDTNIHCTCKQYKGLMVRWEGTFSDVMRYLTGNPGSIGFTI